MQRSLVEREAQPGEAADQQRALLANQRSALERRLADMQRERGALDAEAALQMQRLALAQQAQAQLESLRADNFVSSAQVQAKAEELLGAAGAAPGAGAPARERTSARSRRSKRSGASCRCRRHSRVGALERDLAELAQRRPRARPSGASVVRAPQDGVVSAVLADARPDA